MNAIAHLGGSVAGPLSDVEYDNFAGLEIVHVQLQILPRKDYEPLDFQVKPIPTARLDIEAYAAEVARNHGVTLKSDGARVLRLGEPSPWDIPVTQQCWVLLELDPLVPGWQFYDAGIENKEDDAYSYDFGTHYAMPDGSPPQPTPIKGDGCKVIYFSVAQRDAVPNNHHYTSMLIQFVRTSDGKRFKVIFDPDVPNLGGAKIP